jgi:hypothetical protein
LTRGVAGQTLTYVTLRFRPEPISGMRRALVLSLALALTACESDADKLRRLETEAALTSLELMGLQRTLRDSAAYLTGPQLDSVTERLAEARTKATLAQRDLDRFLR